MVTVTRTRYVFTQDIGEKLAEAVENITGVSVDGVGLTTSGRRFEIYFDDTDLTPTQRQQVLDALPKWVTQLYSVERVVEEVESEAGEV